MYIIKYYDLNNNYQVRTFASEAAFNAVLASLKQHNLKIAQAFKEDEFAVKMFEFAHAVCMRSTFTN
jgi:hypothetical protein